MCGRSGEHRVLAHLDHGDAVIGDREDAGRSEDGGVPVTDPLTAQRIDGEPQIGCGGTPGSEHQHLNGHTAGIEISEFHTFIELGTITAM